MKLKVISDQHFEFRPLPAQRQAYLKFFHGHAPEADACVIAGDIDVIGSDTAMRFQEICERENQVFYVPGNHEYYNGIEAARVDQTLRKLASRFPRLTILTTGKAVEFMGRRVLGDTMWVRRTRQLEDTRHLINDSWKIKNFWQDIPPRNEVFNQFLKEELRAGDIVVTHHLPSNKSSPRIFVGHPTEAWFVCDQEPLITERKPALWIHGHTHARCDYMLGETRVFANPLGYPQEKPDFSGCIPAVIEV